MDGGAGGRVSRSLELPLTMRHILPYFYSHNMADSRHGGTIPLYQVPPAYTVLTALLTDAADVCSLECCCPLFLESILSLNSSSVWGVVALQVMQNFMVCWGGEVCWASCHCREHDC